MLRKVKIYGHLEKKFGRDHEYDVDSISEAVKLLIANYKGFKEELRKGYYRIVRGSDIETGDGLFEEEITMQFGNGDFHIVPVLEGATDQAGKGWGQIIAGVILLVVSYFVPVIAPYTVPMGIGLIMSGIATLMMPSIPDPQDDRDERESSYTFNGAVNRIEQGSAIPICYGRFGLGSIVVASSLVAKDT